MRTLFVAPLKTNYHDNTTWFTHNQKDAAFQGVWLKPGERVVVLPPESKFKTGDKVVATKNTVWGDMAMTVSSVYLNHMGEERAMVVHPVMGDGSFLTSELDFA